MSDSNILGKMAFDYWINKFSGEEYAYSLHNNSNNSANLSIEKDSLLELYAVSGGNKLPGFVIYTSIFQLLVFKYFNPLEIIVYGGK